MCWVPLRSTQPTGDSDRTIATIRSYCRLGGGASYYLGDKMNNLYCAVTQHQAILILASH